MVGVAEEARPLGAELDDLEQRGAGVVRAAQAACDGRGVQPFPQVPVGEDGEGGLFGGEDEREEVAVETAGAVRPRPRARRG